MVGFQANTKVPIIANSTLWGSILDVYSDVSGCLTIRMCIHICMYIIYIYMCVCVYVCMCICIYVYTWWWWLLFLLFLLLYLLLLWWWWWWWWWWWFLCIYIYIYIYIEVYTIFMMHPLYCTFSEESFPCAQQSSAQVLSRYLQNPCRTIQAWILP